MCLPLDLVDNIKVDVTALKLGGSLLVRDVKIDPKLRILTPQDVAVAIVSAPKEEEVVAETAEAAAGTEPEVIAKEKKEGEAAEGEAAEGKEKGGKEKAAPAGKEKAAGDKGGAAKEKPASEEGKKKK